MTTSGRTAREAANFFWGPHYATASRQPACSSITRRDTDPLRRPILPLRLQQGQPALGLSTHTAATRCEGCIIPVPAVGPLRLLGPSACTQERYRCAKSFPCLMPVLDLESASLRLWYVASVLSLLSTRNDTRTDTPMPSRARRSEPSGGSAVSLKIPSRGWRVCSSQTTLRWPNNGKEAPRPGTHVCAHVLPPHLGPREFVLKMDRSHVWTPVGLVQ